MNPFKRRARRLLDDTVADMETWSDVATEPRARGITGRVMDPRSCPVANYLNAVTGKRVSVGSGTASYLKDLHNVRLPDKVNQFTWDFDCDKYPDLKQG